MEINTVFVSLHNKYASNSFYLFIQLINAIKTKEFLSIMHGLSFILKVELL